jgi:hypothetical protein
LSPKGGTDAVANVTAEFREILIEVKPDRSTANHLAVDFGEVERGLDYAIGKIHAVV